MPCQECNDTILNPIVSGICVGCPDGCADQMDLDCVVYHPDNDTPSLLYNLGLPNLATATEIIEKIDFLIGQNFNIDLTVVDSSTINFTTSGPAKHVLTGAVKVSADAGNKIEIRADGLYVP